MNLNTKKSTNIRNNVFSQQLREGADANVSRKAGKKLIRLCDNILVVERLLVHQPDKIPMETMFEINTYLKSHKTSSLLEATLYDLKIKKLMQEGLWDTIKTSVVKLKGIGKGFLQLLQFVDNTQKIIDMIRQGFVLVGKKISEVVGAKLGNARDILQKQRKKLMEEIYQIDKDAAKSLKSEIAEAKKVAAWYAQNGVAIPSKLASVVIPSKLKDDPEKIDISDEEIKRYAMMNERRYHNTPIKRLQLVCETAIAYLASFSYQTVERINVVNLLNSGFGVINELNKPIQTKVIRNIVLEAEEEDKQTKNENSPNTQEQSEKSDTLKKVFTIVSKVWKYVTYSLISPLVGLVGKLVGEGAAKGAIKIHNNIFAKYLSAPMFVGMLTITIIGFVVGALAEVSATAEISYGGILEHLFMHAVNMLSAGASKVITMLWSAYKWLVVGTILAIELMEIIIKGAEIVGKKTATTGESPQAQPTAA